MSKPYNPPAFPTEWSHGLEPGEAMQTGEHTAQYPGMTLHDWFAGQALAGLCANPELLKQMPATIRLTKSVNDVDEFLANMSLKIADTMIATREKSNG